MHYRAVWNNQDCVGKGEEEGKIWVRGGHQQEAEYTASSSRSAAPKRVSSREARWGLFHDKHGKEVEGETSWKQEQPGQYIFNLNLHFKQQIYLTFCFLVCLPLSLPSGYLAFRLKSNKDFDLSIPFILRLFKLNFLGTIFNKHTAFVLLYNGYKYHTFVDICIYTKHIVI